MGINKIPILRSGKGWPGESRRHREAALKGIRKREAQKIVEIGIRNTPVVGDLIDAYEGTKTVITSTKRIVDTYR